MLKDYAVNVSRIQYGLTRTQLKILAYDFAEHNRKIVPQSWAKNLSAGEDWLYGFMNRFKYLFLRRPEATCSSRATSFNKQLLQSFKKICKKILENIILIITTSIMPMRQVVVTIQNMGNIKVIACKKDKQVGKINSAERGILVTMPSTVNAIGNAIPPSIAFPRVHFKYLMVHDSPPGTVGTAQLSSACVSFNDS